MTRTEILAQIILLSARADIAGSNDEYQRIMDEVERLQDKLAAYL
jgi:hypothetical protein